MDSIKKNNEKYLIGVYLIVLFLLIVISLLFFPFYYKQHQDLSILLDLRLPAVLTAIASGMSLASSGFVLQNLFKNKLADPYMLGISSGSSLMVSLSVVAFSSFGLHQYLLSLGITISALIGAVLVIFLLIFLGKKFGYGLYMLLFGIIFTYLSGSVQMLIQYIANPSELKQLSLWNLGTFTNTNLNESIVFLIVVVFTIVIMQFKTKQLALYLLGETTAKSAGLNVNKMMSFYLISCAVLIGFSVSFCGPIAFIGLSVPNVIKLFHGKALPKWNHLLCVFLGGIMALFCYILGYCFTDFVIPVNVISAALGSPIILYILIYKRRQ